MIPVFLALALACFAVAAHTLAFNTNKRFPHTWSAVLFLTSAAGALMFLAMSLGAWLQGSST